VYPRVKRKRQREGRKREEKEPRGEIEGEDDRRATGRRGEKGDNADPPTGRGIRNRGFCSCFLSFTRQEVSVAARRSERESEFIATFLVEGKDR